MKILLLSATQHEIEPFLKTSPKIDILITGIGIHAAVYRLTKQLCHHHYDMVIQAGLAGSFNNTTALGEVVMVNRDCFGDVGVMENNTYKSIQDLNLSNEPEWLSNHNPILNQLSYKQVSAITVNTISDDDPYILKLKQKWNADIESMEGAALHYVCQHQQVGYLQVRSISNKVGIRDKKLWKLKESINSLNNELEKIINHIMNNRNE